MVIRAIVTAGMSLAVVLLTAEAAMACSCAYISPKTKLAESEAAVTARLLALKRLDEGASPSGLADFVYRTGRVVKGLGRGLKRGRRLVVRSTTSSASCGLSTDPGGLTGLFLMRSRGRWAGNLCDQISAAQMRRLARGADVETSSKPQYDQQAGCR
jgi:hypothetical protein